MSVSKSRLIPAIAILWGFSGAAFATTIQTFGAGSAVLSVEGVANFEDLDALFDNPYSEGGMDFSRTALSFNNNGCGYAGCAGHLGFSGFAPGSNYMYGVGISTGGYFEISAGGGGLFSALEFVTGTGFYESTLPFAWATYDATNTLISSGSGVIAAGAVIGFSDDYGFRTLRYTSSHVASTPNFTSSYNAPAFDSVQADFSAVPEPGTLSLIGAGLSAFFCARRRRSD